MKRCCTYILVILVLCVPFVIQKLSTGFPNPSGLIFANSADYTDKKINCFLDGKIAFVDLKVEWAKVKEST